MTTHTPCPGCVRLAEPADEGDLLALVRDMHHDEESLLRNAQGAPFPFNEEKARGIIQRAVIRNRNAPDADRIWIGVVGAPGKLHGSACVAVSEPWCADGEFLVEKWNWVYPAFRKTDASQILIAFSTAIAHSMKLRLYSMSQTREVSAKSRLYERKIGAPVGSLFHYAAGAA